MNLSFIITRKEFKTTLLKYVVISYFSTWRLILLIMLSFLIGIYFPVSEVNTDLYALTIYPIGVITIFLLYFLLLRFFIPYVKFRKKYTTQTDTVVYSVILNNDNLQLVTNTSETTIFWRDIVTIKRFKNYLIIYILDNSVIIIHEPLFEDKNIANEFLQTIQNGIIKIRGTLRIPIFLRPPYLLGILCFFPILGVLVGIVFILLGIFNYKSKFMIVLGSVGIIFTIALYSTLFPELWNKKESDKQFAGISKMQLNSLVKDIEFYKIQNGKYPTKLEELQSSNSMIFINDPLLAGNKENIKFNYILLGEKYKLFSSGVDRIPNTKDDIFPEVNDSTKVGFIK